MQVMRELRYFAADQHDEMPLHRDGVRPGSRGPAARAGAEGGKERVVGLVQARPPCRELDAGRSRAGDFSLDDEKYSKFVTCNQIP